MTEETFTAKKLHPETQMVGGGVEGVKKPQDFSATYIFPSLEEGKNRFDIALHKVKGIAKHIYSRLSHEGAETIEMLYLLWTKYEACAAFANGMAATSTMFFSLLKLGDLLVLGVPCYGGTYILATEILKKFGIQCILIYPWEKKEDIYNKILQCKRPIKMMFIEPICNPTNDTFDMKMCREIVDDLNGIQEEKALLVVDNTYNPINPVPKNIGADLIVCSATKYIGGHSDLLSGFCAGNAELIEKIVDYRTEFGSIVTQETARMVSRSFETVPLRIKEAEKNAMKIASFLQKHDQVEEVKYPGLQDDGSFDLTKIQFPTPGALIAFRIKGGEEAASLLFKNLKLIKNAVSLGSTESLIEHPASHTHNGIADDLKEKIGISGDLIRLSVGIENVDDLIEDLVCGFSAVVAYNSITNISVEVN